MKTLLLLLTLAQATTPRPPVRSFLCVADRDGKNERVIYQSDKHFEAPNWSPDGRWIVFNSAGSLYRLPAAGKAEPERIDTGDVKNINNDHGLTRDGKWIAISAGPVYVLPFAGGTPKRLTEKTPSYFHGWAPDNRTLAYCARRNDNFDLYAITTEGGEEKRLTTHPGYDDGPDYTPDGRWIWFNSDRAGTWDLWRIPATGAGENDKLAERITSDEREDWFPHPSPNGQWIVYLSFEKGTKGHPANQQVQLKLMHTRSRQGRVIKELFGGQGTINVNSWSPDSKRFAYVRYELLKP